ncbi:MAG: AraC family transcriptional regulator, partial [Novosphingobium sp.]
MFGSLSEFLNTFQFRSQSWCLVEIGDGQALRIPHADATFCYAVIEGDVTVAGVEGREFVLSAGQVGFVLSGEAHSLRSQDGARVGEVSLLQNGGYVDIPPRVTLGRGRVAARVLCGRLKVRWPTGHRPRGMPARLTLATKSAPINVEQLREASSREGGSAVLTQLASLLFVCAFRETQACHALFAASNRFDPISMAKQFIQLHPFQNWTVEDLAKKVGMSRSNFAARFVRQVGKTPMDVVTEERMLMAAELLERSDLKIADVSEQVGYRSEAAFHNRFTTHFGISPGCFRRKYRQAAAVEPGEN